jgi:phospholipid/cholesterol/gamma-HCH transport system permease protein
MAGIPETALAVHTLADGRRRVILAGHWTLTVLARRAGELRRQLAEAGGAAQGGEPAWDCLGIEFMDSTGALLLWRAWGRRLPQDLQVRPEHRRILERLAAAAAVAAADAGPRTGGVGGLPFSGPVIVVWHHLGDFVTLIGQVMLDLVHIVRRPPDMPWKEVSANIYRGGVCAMPVVGLVGFMVGIVLAYLFALQLQRLGADLLIVNVLGIGIIRELGPVLVAVLVAGRSGSAMTAQIGVMRVTEELDALAVMGVARSLRLVFPKVVALAVVMPMLELWASAAALAGGIMAAQAQLEISPLFFLDQLAHVVPLVNVWLALGKGVVFGILVALLACHFGLRVRPNTESLSANTTASVVAGITAVILVDALIAVAARQVGLPLR